MWVAPHAQYEYLMDKGKRNSEMLEIINKKKNRSWWKQYNKDEKCSPRTHAVSQRLYNGHSREKNEGRKKILKLG